MRGSHRRPIMHAAAGAPTRRPPCPPLDGNVTAGLQRLFKLACKGSICAAARVCENGGNVKQQTYQSNYGCCASAAPSPSPAACARAACRRRHSALCCRQCEWLQASLQ